MDHQAAAILVFLYFAVNGKDLPGFEPTFHIAGVKPDTLHGVPLTLAENRWLWVTDVADRHFKQRHTLGAEQCRSADFADKGGHFTGREVTDFAGIGAILIAE